MKAVAVTMLTVIFCGGFAIFGILIAIINKASNGKAIKKKDFSCEGCPSAAACNGQNCAEKREAAAK